MTISEYHLRFKKFKEIRVDNLREMHLQAWLNHAVTSKKKNGKKLEPTYKKFNEFWDESKSEEHETKVVDQKLNQLLLSANLSSEKGGN